MAPEQMPSPKGNLDFQPSFFRGEMLNFEGAFLNSGHKKAWCLIAVIAVENKYSPPKTNGWNLKITHFEKEIHIPNPHF